MENKKYEQFFQDLYDGKLPPCPECGTEKENPTKANGIIHHFHCEQCGFTANVN
ncbi:MAG: hypothetical protein K1V97_02900 [Lachnospiraceae bacterium]